MEKNSITISDIEHLAELSGLEFNDEEKCVMLEQVIGILDMFNGCSEADERAIENAKIVKIDELRNDEVRYSLSQELALKNAPECKAGYVVSHKVVD